jgi:site-specific recombinase XerC
MEDLLGEFSRWNRQTASEQSVRNNLGKIRRFLRERGVAQPDQITRGEVQAFLISLREGGSAPRTQLKYRSAISKFARWLVQQELLEVNPADGAQVQRAAARVPRYVPWASRARLLRRIMASERPWMADAVRYALLTGARLGTIRDLRLGETPPAGATVVAVRSLKTGRACYVPVSEALELLFRKWRARLAAGQAASARVFPRHDRRSWGLWFSRLALGLEGFGQGASTGRWWHALRSTFAVRMAARNPATGRPASPWELMAMMGHQSPEVTIGYVQVARAAGLLRT